MLQIDPTLTPAALKGPVARMFELSARKIRALSRAWDPARGTPVFTRAGIYTSRGWTEWTRGFLYGSAILQFDATGDEEALAVGTEGTRRHMAGHVTHTGVHDHGFNNVSTYGSLHRLAREGRLAVDESEVRYYELALQASGAVQAARWTGLPGGLGYIHSFNGPHSLFADTIRSLRSLALGHQLGHALLSEGDRRVSLLERLLTHAETTARFNVYFGEGRDAYDVRGRVAHESIFNVRDGAYRCPSTQQGYSPFTTWTRGLAWVLLGYAEELEFLATLPARTAELSARGGKTKVLARFLETATATADFYLANTARDGIPYWDTGAPGLERLGDYLDRPAEPFNDHEPVDSSAAAIAAQGLLRLGRHLRAHGRASQGRRYLQAALTVARTLLDEPYLATSKHHQGLLLHAVYHRPNGWDHVPRGRRVPCGEACLWGDYHLRELGLCIQRLARDEPEYVFFIPR
jgi:hypothetical protein